MYVSLSARKFIDIGKVEVENSEVHCHLGTCYLCLSIAEAKLLVEAITKALNNAGAL